MPTEVSTVFSWVGYGAAFVAGCWIIGWFITCLCAAVKVEGQMERLEKMFKESTRSNWEFEVYMKKFQEQNPLKKEKK